MENFIILQYAQPILHGSERWTSESREKKNGRKRRMKLIEEKIIESWLR